MRSATRSPINHASRGGQRPARNLANRRHREIAADLPAAAPETPAPLPRFRERRHDVTIEDRPGHVDREPARESSIADRANRVGHADRPHAGRVRVARDEVRQTPLEKRPRAPLSTAAEAAVDRCGGQLEKRAAGDDRSRAGTRMSNSARMRKRGVIQAHGV